MGETISKAYPSTPPLSSPTLPKPPQPSHPPSGLVSSYGRDDYVKPYKAPKAQPGEGCPRCGGKVFAAEEMLAKGKVSAYRRFRFYHFQGNLMSYHIPKGLCYSSDFSRR